MAPKATSLRLLRIVIREDFSRTRCDLLLRDIMAAVEFLDTHEAKAIALRRDTSQRWALLINSISKPKAVTETGGGKSVC